MARPEKSELPTTLNELMGRGVRLENLEDLPDVLGEKLPEMSFDEVGRLRLLKAMRIRFGDGFRNIPGVKKVLQDFDQEMRVRSVIKKNKER